MGQAWSGRRNDWSGIGHRRLRLSASIFASEAYFNYAIASLGPGGLPWTSFILFGALSTPIVLILTIVQATFFVFAVTHLRRTAPPAAHA